MSNEYGAALLRGSDMSSLAPLVLPESSHWLHVYTVTETEKRQYSGTYTGQLSTTPPATPGQAVQVSVSKSTYIYTLGEVDLTDGDHVVHADPYSMVIGGVGNNTIYNAGFAYGGTGNARLIGGKTLVAGTGDQWLQDGETMVVGDGAPRDAARMRSRSWRHGRRSERAANNEAWRRAA